MTKDWEPVELLRHYRHDWLNHLQLIKGNLALGKTERVEVLLDEIIQQAKNESKLSNINGNLLAERLLTYNWEAHNFRLSFEVITEPHELHTREKQILMVTERLLEWFDRHCYYGADNHLLFVLNESRGHPVIEFDFQGKLMIESVSLNDLESTIVSTGQVEIQEVSMGQEECFVRLHFIND
ncbi:Spo0B C-terminal domain-containing protein [Alteribacter aurantiacus]|uniref:Spo0B C-terminal domain-containing protein n=1 Tax=Alteribacter aurantiacus TaxID=254410 RepID=UPI00042A9234|nr:Spo0B C-terminal domain-containing protein [Alteribacter aurantiacus]